MNHIVGKVDAFEVCKSTVMHIKIKRLRWFTWRARLGLLLLNLAAWVIPVPVEIEDE